ncbi:Nicotinamide mononucleotide adenylyltransferase 1 [Auxenochlorella protothecoides]|uniref:Nicotinamide mononucleotide adenylyltransferase 1 n=1 Tax=Auxenochlorella protothecoides TaxID=3075 RepID=A0A087SND1_AUXPR|nr:Nicotinamide mononucleotide adenylyltransferase 1 [Auxenochlorella protothecoides]KFM27235.1 Nicotinamide mononucleotide adenylyltransferase 1 [Auxenochlorella protothecoides]
MELARDAMTAQGYDVLGGYLSPVSDAYWKEGLAPAAHRVAMAQAAAASSDFVMVDAWEAAQPHYTRTLVELQRVQAELGRAFSTEERGGAGVLASSAGPAPSPRAVLVCGADVLETMADPSLWRQDLLDALLSQHGVVCVTRGGARALSLLETPGTLLHQHAGRVSIVQEPVPTDISSSLVRKELEQGRSVRYLVPDDALTHIYTHIDRSLDEPDIMSSSLVWELVKKNNAFLKKNINGIVVSTEPGNLMNKHSYKYSGLANFGKTMDVSADESGLLISTSSKKRAGNLRSFAVKSHARKATKSAVATAGAIRPDLKDAARAKASALAWSLRVKKAAAKTSA